MMNGKIKYTVSKNNLQDGKQGFLDCALIIFALSPPKRCEKSDQDTTSPY